MSPYFEPYHEGIFAGLVLPVLVDGIGLNPVLGDGIGPGRIDCHSGGGGQTGLP